MASVSEKNGKVYSAWNDNWHAATLPQKEGMIAAIANSDACLTGGTRYIFIHYNGELVARADPIKGIEVLK